MNGKRNRSREKIHGRLRQRFAGHLFGGSYAKIGWIPQRIVDFLIRMRASACWRHATKVKKAPREEKSFG
jgi:hypothetical protein